MTISHDPSAVLDYSVDWSAWLASGETISASTWVVSSGLTLASQSNTTTVATAWISGGTAPTDYRITNRITTSAGRTDDRSITIWCRER